jgi:hypothetical protein
LLASDNTILHIIPETTTRNPRFADCAQPDVTHAPECLLRQRGPSTVDNGWKLALGAALLDATRAPVSAHPAALVSSTPPVRHAPVKVLIEAQSPSAANLRDAATTGSGQRSRSR